MSLLFAETCTHDNPFQSDFYLRPLSTCEQDDLCFGSGSISLTHHWQQDYFSSEMRIRHEVMLAEHGFYDHLDPIFHDLTVLNSRHDDLRPGRPTSLSRPTTNSRSPEPNGKGKEYIRSIPITIETSDRNRVSSLPSTPSINMKLKEERKPFFESSYRPRSRTTVRATPRHGRSSPFIPIPVTRGITGMSSGRQKLDDDDKLRSSDADCIHSKLGSTWKTFTPTTEENGGKQNRSSDGDLTMDSDDFFDKPRSRLSNLGPRKIPRLNDAEVIEIYDSGSFVRPRSPVSDIDGRTKPVNRQVEPGNSLSACGTSGSSHSSLESSTASRRGTAGMAGDVVDGKVWNRYDQDDSLRSRKNKRVPCSFSGCMDVTPAPSYPIYRNLKPRLAAQARQVDYIRGDGNCFFRALSKEVYGSEEFHAEWRQAVCDHIQNHPNVFRQYVDDCTVSEHLTIMREPGTWATTCEIYAAATLLKRNIYVLAPSPSCEDQYHWLLFSPCAVSGAGIGGSMGTETSQNDDNSDDDVHPCYVTLCHTNANHYDRIVPNTISPPCNCCIAPPSLKGGSVTVDLTMSDEDDETRTCRPTD